MEDSSHETEKLLGDSCTCNSSQDVYNPMSNFESMCGMKKKPHNGKLMKNTFYNPCSVCNSNCVKCNSDTHQYRSKKICVGAAKIFSENLNYALYIAGGLVLLLIILGSIMALTAYPITEHNIRSSIINNPMSKRNVMCKEITPENCTNFLEGSIDAKNTAAGKFVDPKQNVFYVIDKPLTGEQACDVESVLQLLPDKLVFVIEMEDSDEHKNCSTTADYIPFLQKFYSNLNRIKTDKKHYFEGTIFENDWSKANEMLSTFAAKVLTIWQFGGAVLSENLTMNSRSIFDRPDESCKVDKDLLYCPHECSAYSYSLMKAILNKMKTNCPSSNHNIFEEVIDDSIKCSCKDLPEDGCRQVQRLQRNDMCDGKTSGVCQFIRLDKLHKLNHYRETLKQFCHYIGQVLS